MLRPGERLEPWWLERQRDPTSPDFVPGVSRVNVTHRSWTLLGSLGSGRRAVVDPRGLVVAGDGGWSLDWWIGADDRWHLPSREVAVRQHLLDGAPVVETAMRVPGGDARHRCFAFRSGDEDFVAVEIVNDTAIPFAVALAVRPVNPLGDASIEEVDLDGEVVVVNGARGIFLPKAPSRSAVSPGAEGDVVHVVLEGLAAPEWAGPSSCRAGELTAAFVFPLPHTATLRAVLPLARPGPAATAGRAARRSPAVEPPSSVPAAAQVASGWEAQTRVGPRVELPDDRLASAFTAARCHLLLAHGGEDVATWPARCVPWTETASIIRALDQLGHHGEAEQLLVTFPDRQALDGGLAVDGADGLSANGAVLYALARHWAVTRDRDVVDALVGPIAKAGHWIDKRRTARRGRRLLDGPLLAALWSVAGLHNAVPMLRSVEQPEVADDFSRFAGELLAAIDGASRSAERDHGAAVLPATFTGEVDPRVAGNLVAASLGAPLAGQPRLASTAEWVAARLDVDGAVFEEETRWGLSTSLTLQLATVELQRGDPRATDRLNSVLDLATSTWTWPEVVHPRSGGGSTGDGHHAATTAELCTFVLRLLVSEAEGELHLSPVVPASWLGASWEVHDLPTAFGRFGFAVRWHGERPALLWQLDPHPGVELPRLRAPGLDGSWTGEGAAGEALLAPVQPPSPGRETEPFAPSSTSPTSFG